MESRQRLVHSFMQCGLNSNSDLVPYGDYQDSSGDPLEMTYKSSLLDIHPPSPDSFDPVATKEICLPNGVKFIRGSRAACPPPKFHPFVITRQDGSNKYGGCLTFYTEVKDSKILSSMQLLLNMYKEQLRCEKEPRFTHPDAYHSNPEQLLSPSTVNPNITTLYMTKCIAMVLKLPYVSFIQQYLSQLLEHVQQSSSASNPPLSLESYVHNLLYEVLCPAPGQLMRITAPLSIINVEMPDSELPLFDYNLEDLFALVPTATFVDVLTCAFLENQIMLLSKDNEKLMLVAESLKTLLFPFEWNHVYVPIVPTSYLHLTEAPVNYIMGLSANISVEDQADICVLDIDNNKLTLPEDIPNLPNRDELIDAINSVLIKPSRSSPGDPFSFLKLNSFSPPHSPKESPSSAPFAERRSNRPPKLKFVRQNRSEGADNLERSQTKCLSNLQIRTLVLEHIARMFQNYEKFVIFPLDKLTFIENTRENLDNFERDSFLCDQAQQNLTFLSQFLETHIFSHFIYSKILTTFDEFHPTVHVFDKKIKELSEIRSPVSSEVKRESTPPLSEIICRPPIERGTFCSADDFPILRGSLLQEEGGKKSTVSRKLLRQRSIKEAKAKLENSSSSGGSSTTASMGANFSKVTLNSNDTFEKMMKSHADFTTQLLKDCKNKINRLLVLKMGAEGQGLGYDYIIRDVEENSMVGAICDLVERVWSHGIVSREGKSALWNTLRKELESRDRRLGHYSSPSSTGSTSEDDSVEERGVFFRRSSQNTLPPDITPELQLYIDINNIKDMRALRTDTARARAWIRLSIEKQCLQQYLELITCDNELLCKRYKDYAFLRDEEKLTPFIKYLYTLSAVPFTCFTASFPNISVQYKLYIINSTKFNAQSTANPWVRLCGEKGDTGVYSFPRGENIVTIVTDNLGELRSLWVGHDNSGLSPGWCLDHILVENLLNQHCTLFQCSSWLSRANRDGSIERLLIGERIDRTSYKRFRNSSKSERSSTCSTIDSTIKAHELLATAVNSLVQHSYQGTNATTGEPGTQIRLLCGPQGLVPALNKLLSSGLRPVSRFNRNSVFVWEFVHKVYTEVSAVNTCHPDQPAITSFVKFVQLLQKPSSNSVGLDGKLQTLVCLGIREGVLHRWIYMMSQSLAASRYYDSTSIFKQDLILDQIIGLLRLLDDMRIIVDPSLTQQIESR